MVLNLNWKAGLDRSPWRPEAPCIALGSAGTAFIYDQRNNNTRLPFIFFYRSTGILDAFNTFTGDWLNVTSSLTLATVGAGSCAIFHPSQGPGVGTLSGSGSIGTISAGSTTTVTLSTVLLQAVGLNQLADRGDGIGFRMRVIGMSSGGSGHTNEVTITKNTAGTTPTITFTPALDFTPQAGDGYEILSGKVYVLGIGASPIIKMLDIGTGYPSSVGLSNTNLPTIGTDSFFLATAEVYISNDRNPGDGFIDNGATYNQAGNKACSVTGSPTSITIQAAALTNPSIPSLGTNEYRNFQIRIVQDATAPTSVGQRRNITSHTSGNTPTFTVPAFTVTPSTAALFVVEQNNDRLLLRTSASTNMYNYSIGGNAWDASTTWAAGGTGNGAGVMIAPAFGITRDPTGNRLQGQMFVFTGGNNANVDMFDITAGATGAWTAAIAKGFGGAVLSTTGTCGCYDPVTLGGQYFHISTVAASSAARMSRFNVLTQTFEAGTYMPYFCGSSVIGQRMAMSYVFDGATKLAVLYQEVANAIQMFSQLVPI
jgi:hypothetical protein